MSPRSASLRLALFLVASAPAVFGQAKLDATYTFGQVGAEFDSGCPPGSQVLLYNEFGTATFLPNGTVTLSSTGTEICSAGTYSTGPSAGPAVYSLDYDGNLVLDFDPSNPGTEIATLFLSPDRQVLVEVVPDPGFPILVVGVLQSTGLSNASLSGSYALSTFEQDVLATGVRSSAGFGSIQFDGVGGWSRSLAKRSIDSNGASAVTPTNDSGTYQVLANGQLQWNGGGLPVGQVSPDGRIGLLVNAPGAPGNLSLFVRKKGAAPTPAALDEDWVVVSYGGSHGLPGGEVEVEDETATSSFDALANSYVLTGSSDYVSNQGVGGVATAGAGSFVLGTDGSLSATEAGDPYSSTGWLAAGERFALFATTAANAPGPAMSLFLRQWGSLAADVDSISVGLGGTQTLTVRATDEFAGKPYVVLGTTMGSYPGLPWGGQLVPLNYSAYLLFTLNNLNVGPFTNTFGVLDANGRATASITLPAGTYASAAGASLISSLVVFQPPGFGTTIHVSNPVPLNLVP